MPSNAARTLDQWRKLVQTEPILAQALVGGLGLSARAITAANVGHLQSKTRTGASIVEISRVQRPTPEWWLKLELSHEVRDRYGIAEAIPTILTRKSHVRGEILRSFDRLTANDDCTKDLAFLLTDAIDASSQVASARRPIVHVPLRALPNLDIEKSIANVLRATDFFDFVLVIKDDIDFYGRQTLLDRAYRAVSSLENNVGLFGLRKTGKSSVLRALERAFLTRGIAPAYFQLNLRQSLPIERFRWSLLDVLVEATNRTWAKWGLPIERDADRAYIVSEIRQARELDAIDFSAALERFGKLIRPHKSVVLVDESDLLLPKALDPDSDNPTQDSDDARRVERAQVFSELRGCIEEMDLPIRFVFAGVSSALFTSATLFGYENYLYQFGESVGIGAMSRDEARALMRGLGRRSGLNFTAEATDLLYEMYGGMPFLLRRAGSRIAKSPARLKAREQVPFLVRLGHVNSIIEQRDEDSPWGQAVQLLRSFELYHPKAAREVLDSVRTGCDLASQTQLLAERYGLRDATSGAFVGVLKDISVDALTRS